MRRQRASYPDSAFTFRRENNKKKRNIHRAPPAAYALCVCVFVWVCVHPPYVWACEKKSRGGR